MEVNASGLASERLYPQTRGADSPLRKLALGILRRALLDMMVLGKSSNKDWETWHQDAVEWFFCEQTTPGSFYWVCGVLETNSWQLRERLRAYERSERKHQEQMLRELFRFRIPH